MADTAKKLDLSKAAQAAEPRTVERPRRSLPWRKFLVYFVLLLGAAAALVPFLWMLSMSAMDVGQIVAGRLVPQELARGDIAGLVNRVAANYGDAWTRVNFAQYMWNSTRI